MLLVEAKIIRMTCNTSKWSLFQRALLLSLLWSYGEILSLLLQHVSHQAITRTICLVLHHFPTGPEDSVDSDLGARLFPLCRSS